MSSHGLNKAQRGIVRSLVANEYSGSYIREQIRDMVIENGPSNWDYNKNVSFCEELAGREAPETAKYLEKVINGRGHNL